MTAEVLNKSPDASDSNKNQRNHTANRLRDEAAYEFSGGNKANKHAASETTDTVNNAKDKTSSSAVASNTKSEKSQSSNDATKDVDATKDAKETKSDGSVITRKNGLIESVKQGNVQVDYKYQTDNGEVKRSTSPDHQPLLKEATVTINGKAQRYDLEQLANSGDNKGKSAYELEQLQRFTASDGKLSLKTLAVEQSGADAGKLSLRTEDGAKCTFGFTEKSDGKAAARIESKVEKNGTSYQYEYGWAADKTMCTAYTAKIATYDGNQLVDRVARVNDSNVWDKTETNTDGRVTKSQMQDVHITGDGQIFYRQLASGASEKIFGDMLDSIYGPRWLRANDLTAAKEHFIEVAHGRLFGGDRGLENHINNFINRRKKQGNGHHLPEITEDQMASTLRSLASVMETSKSERRGGAKDLTEKEIAKGTQQMLDELANPYDKDWQGQIGSCGLNSVKFIAEMGHPELVAKCFAGAYTKGSFKGKSFNAFDLKATSGQNASNHTILSFEAKKMGFAHLNESFRGTTEDDMRAAAKGLLGHTLPYYNPRRDSPEVLKKNAAKHGGSLLITMGGGHAQDATMRYWNGKWVPWKQNHWPRDANWAGGHHGRMAEGPWDMKTL